jgi:chaperonin GroES
MAATATPAKTKTKKAVGIRPIHDKILVSRDEPEAMTAAGIYLPESGKEKPKSGTILAVGTGRINTETGHLIPLTVKVGDKVLFTSYAGTEIKLDGEEYLMMSESDILAIVD